MNPARGWLRLGVRLPLALYRARLGGLFGQRLLRLTHTGRKTGLRRQVVLEVVEHDAASGVYVIASGWGEKADWFRNVQSTPAVLVMVGRREFAAIAERMPLDLAEATLRRYAERHPAAFRSLARFLCGAPPAGEPVDVHEFAAAVPLIALRLA